MNITELQIVTCWQYTETQRGCEAFINAMRPLYYEAAMFGDVAARVLISEACLLAAAKRDILTETVH